MADVTIARYDALTGWLPQVCPTCGCPSDRVAARLFFAPTARWLSWLHWVNLTGFVLAVIFGRSELVYVLALGLLISLRLGRNRARDVVQMPDCSKCAESRASRLRWGGRMSLVSVSFLLWLLFSPGTASLGQLVVMLALSVVGVMLFRFVGVRGSLDGPWLRLTGVHPAFVATLRPNPASPGRPGQLPADSQSGVYHVRPQAYRQPPYSG